MRVLLTPLLLFAGAFPAAAQLDLPDKPRAEGDDPAPRSRGGGISQPGLDLPDELTPSRAETLGLAAPRNPVAEPEAESEVVAASPALELLSEARKLGLTDSERELEIAAELFELGELGILVAREALSSKVGAERLLAMRVLLMNGLEADREQVIAGLRGRVPGRSSNALINCLASLDPVAASPELMIELLDHEQSSMRAAAAGYLAKELSEAHIEPLARLMNSARADTRLLATNLLSQFDVPASIELMFVALSDSSSHVSSLAAQTLARSSNEEVEARLLTAIHSSTTFSRFQSYALLAIVEREDHFGRALLGEETVDLLLRNLADGTGLSVGAAACALAGIGFQSGLTTGSPWLDLLVPHHLVRIVSGSEFHHDLSSLQGPAHRRLALISGLDYGSNGAAWRNWWASAAREFRAHRAVLPLVLADASSMQIDYADSESGSSFSLRGDPTGELSVADASTIWLSKLQCIDLFRVLEREGVFTARRLPGARRGRNGSVRQMKVLAGGYEKSFYVESASSEPWFDRVAEVLRLLREKHRWQTYYPAERRAEKPAAWLSELEYWSTDTGELERGRRFKVLVLDSLEDLRGAPLETALGALEEQFARPLVPNAADFHPLYLRIRAEDFYSPIVARLTRLALRSARAELRMKAEQVDPPALDGGVAIDYELARDLASLLAEQFGAIAIDDLFTVLEACPPDWVRARAKDSSAAMRAASMLALARDFTPGAEEILIDGLKDTDFEVEAAAVRALGERSALSRNIPNTTSARTRWADFILERVGSKTGRVHVSALLAIASSGDDRAVGALLSALSHSATVVRQAAAEGLASVNDPSVAPILVSLLARGPNAVVFAPARRGLVALGEAAHEELLRIVNRREPGLSREAALILAEGCVPQVASPLLTMLTSFPDDERVAAELASLTCIDFSKAPDPAQAWWDWWDTVRHDDAQVWLLAAAERLGLRAPEVSALQGQGTREGGELLLALIRAEEDYIALRARRELRRMLGTVEIDGLTDSPEARVQFLDRHWPQ